MRWDIFTLFWVIESFTKVVAFVLIMLVLIAGAVVAFTFSDFSGQNRRFTVKPIINWTLTAATTFLVFMQLDTYAVIIQRLGKFAGALESLAHLHAALFVSLVIVTSARAFFVISEMENGRYAGQEEVPQEVAKHKWYKVAEGSIRFAIMALLTVFAATFLRVVLPASGSDFDIIGRPTVIAKLSHDCAEYYRTIASVGFGSLRQMCVMSQLTELSSGETMQLAQAIRGPVKMFLMPTYLLMITWCLVVWLAARQTVVDRRAFERALLLQVRIAGLAFLSGVLMLQWITIASSGSLPISLVRSSEGFVTGVLTALSTLGVGITIVCFIYLVRRLGSDFRMLRDLSARRRAVHLGGAAGT